MGLRKADNPLDDGDFVLMSERFARELGEASGPIDTLAVATALQVLAVDWAVLTPAQQGALIREAARALGGIGGQVAEAVDTQFRTTLSLTVADTKVAVSEQLSFRLGLSFTEVDQRVVDSVRSSSGFFIRGEYANHAHAFTRNAQTIVAEGLAQGLRSAEIANDLQAAAQKIGLQRTANYWQVTAMAAQNRARTLTQLNSYQQAGIRRYEFQAIMDERTTDICRMLDGRVFAVEEGLRSYRAVEEDSHFDAVKDHQPWVRSRRSEDPDAQKDLYIKQRSGQEVLVARVTQSAVGTKDRPGRFTNAMDNGTLAGFGVIQPPLHGKCRSTIAPLG